MRRMSLTRVCVTVVLMIAAAPGVAHVVVVPASGTAGQFSALSFLVGEGCAGSTTRSIRIEIPPSVTIAKPQQKVGWTIELAKQPLATPVTVEGGVLKERVASITWRGGSVPDDHFEQFTVLVRLPPKVGTLFFPATQTCEKGEIKWIETPGSAASAKGMSHPAPALKVIASHRGPAGSDRHAHGGHEESR